MIRKLLIRSSYAIGVILLVSGVIIGLTVTKIAPDSPFENLVAFASPIMDLAGAILIFFGLRTQLVANSVQSNFNNFSQLVALINDMEVLYENFEIWNTFLPAENGKATTITTSKGPIAWSFFGIKINHEIQDPSLELETETFLDTLKLLVFTGKAIASFPSNDDYSQGILKMKFKKVGLKFLEPIESLYHYSLNQPTTGTFYDRNEFKLILKQAHDILVDMEIIKIRMNHGHSFVNNGITTSREEVLANRKK